MRPALRQLQFQTIQESVRKKRTPWDGPAFSRFTKYFVTVAKVGSIRKASESLRISASAVDRQILQGEDALGVQLFERVSSGLRLTTAGEILLRATQGWEREMEAVHILFEDLQGLKRGHVEFAIIDALAKAVVPGVLSDLYSRHSGITTRVEVLDNHLVAEAVAHGTADFGLLLDPRSSKDLSVRAHVKVPLGIVSCPEHPIARMKQARFSVCAQYPIIAPAPPLALSEHFEALEARPGVTLQRVTVCDNIQLIKSLVAKNAGLSVLSWLDVAEEISAGELKFTQLLQPAPVLILGLCVNPSRQLSAASRAFLSAFETALTGLAQNFI